MTSLSTTISETVAGTAEKLPYNTLFFLLIYPQKLDKIHQPKTNIKLLLQDDNMKKFVSILVLIIALMPAVSAANQAAIYAENSNGWPVYDVRITVEGVNNDYQETKNSGTNSNYAHFFNYESGQSYRITVYDRDSQLSGSKTVTLSSSDNIWVTLTEGGADDGDNNGEEPQVSLERPDSGATGISRRSVFEWSYSGDTDLIDSAKLFVEEKDSSSDKPWGGNSYSILNDDDREFQLSSSNRLNYNTEYVWGIDISGDNFRDMAYRSFTTESQPEETNDDPSISLEEPDSNERNTQLRPRFEWSATDSDSSNLQYRFFLEKKSYDGDRPWSADSVDRNDNTDYRPSESLDTSTWYVWGVEVTDEEGGSDRAYRYFKTRSETENERPSVSLQSPLNERVGRYPYIDWSSSDPDGDSLDHTVFIEEKDYSGDKPWGGDTLEETVGSSTHFNVDSALDRGQTYVWGVEASDGELRALDYGEFTVRSGDSEEPEPGPSCNLRVDSIQIDDHTLSEEASTQVHLTIDSNGVEQDFRVKINSEEGTYYDKRITVDGQRTITKSVNPDNDVKIHAVTEAVGRPCGYEKWESSNEIIVGDTYSDQDEYELAVDVEDEDGDSIENAEVTVSNGVDLEDETNSNGRSYFSLENGDYELEVSKSGYETVERSFSVSGEDRTIDITLSETEDDIEGEGEFTARVVDGDGDRLEDARVKVENGDSTTKWTDEDGEASFDLEPGDYKVTAWKPDYSTKVRHIEVDKGEEITKGFKLYRQHDIEVSGLNYPDTVCSGATMSVSFRVENTGSSRQVVDLRGEGLGSDFSGRSIILNTGESRRVSLMFTSVQGSGSESFTVEASNSDVGSATGTVYVKSCGIINYGQASDISLSINPDRVLSGRPVQVKGYVDGAQGRSEVTVKVDGEKVGEVSTQPDGYFQTYIRVSQVGMHSVAVETDSISANRDLEALPTVSATMIDPPREVFEGEEFELCAQINSQINPKVVLLRDGVVMQTRQAGGKVCFTPTASNPGEHEYMIRAVTYGEGTAATARIKVLETGPETTSFPESIAAVESESGLVKAEIYNTHDELRRYHIRLEGLPDGWVSTSEKEVVLSKGERDTVYFYIMPKEEGSYSGDIVIESDGSEIYRENITVWSGGTTQEANKGLISKIRAFLSF
ncbi:hypothetical protein GKQ38_05090 [Candidatus Nanohaloarchaea archaeon]|nr:hypothetical protein GKQ38_05090 [Candidatus Nanohaloarchaea archaeon]